MSGIGVRAEADQVAQAVDGLDLVQGSVQEDRLEGFEVAVDVAEDGPQSRASHFPVPES